MRVAIIGSRSAPANIAALILPYIPRNATELVSGGAAGVDRAAEELAALLSLPMRRFFPDYERHGRQAPLMRNLQIIDYADEILAFWDGQSRGTMHSVAECIRRGKPVRVVPLTPSEPSPAPDAQTVSSASPDLTGKADHL